MHWIGSKTIGLFFFTRYINDIGKTVDSSNLHLYADDTVIYSSIVIFSSNIEKAFQTLQLAIDAIQGKHFKSKLVLNAKCMVFSSLNEDRWSHLEILTLKGQQIDRVTSYKYLGIWLD